ncbi:Pentachlorophenol 4-monooxygenase [Thalassoglobus neptunius]|uniref:Pentachlorophenol 4-monooxygenase n=1 Tax=Thalassoglobus neptunius TaxID=1938619 RepID=A0A5C5VMZ8_9PLAN|nr:FAD-dependent monooxygenase [Thalassoglobus neptunius]TWT40036.1 Pentachlorophenol 4-monooxygenase [Thalassoglobus neptunius]
MSSGPQVLVVGAGPTGLLLASELQRRNVDCLIIDAHSEPLHWDRATVIHPRSLEVFESLGIIEQFLDVGVKQRVVQISSGGLLLGELDLSACDSCYGFNIGISEEVTESILTDYLHQQGGNILRSARLVELAEESGEVTATIQNEGRTERVSVQWVVGCDGFHSTTRELTGIKMTGHDIEEPWAVFDATVAGWQNSYEGVYVYLDEVPVILTALPEERWRVYLRPHSTSADLLEEASTTLGRYLSNFSFENVGNPTRFQCHSKVAARFRLGRIFLAGDAAHVCTPAQGHGMNSGIQDAFNLAWKLALVCQGQSTPRILESYEAERRPVAQVIAASGDGAEQMQNALDDTERSCRDEALREMFADPASRHQEVVAETELDIDYSDSPIVIGNRHDVLAAGQRLPGGIEVIMAGSRLRKLHEFTHRTGHTVLLLGRSSEQHETLAELNASIRSWGETPIIEAIFVLSTQPDPEKIDAQVTPSDAESLGVQGVTLLVIRPDGHIGLRADDHHLASLQEYQALLSGSDKT